MLNIFKPKSVDSILGTFGKVINDLETLSIQKQNEIDKANETVVKAEQELSSALAERERAAKVIDKLANLVA